MPYQVIARKWRPQRFDDVVGQEVVTRTLINSLTTKVKDSAGKEVLRLHHAYIFTGLRGTGKTTCARLLAKAVNCHKFQEPTSEPCNECSSCLEINNSKSMDVQEIDAASTTGVENVRASIIDSIRIAPSRDRYRVFIIDEVHSLSTAAFNALLKTLEEPPPGVLFILATTAADKIPATISSRCQTLPFKAIDVEAVAKKLKQIAVSEGIQLEARAAMAIARFGGGSMRDSQSALDQTINFSGSAITLSDVEKSLGTTGVESLHRTMRAISENKGAEALAIVADIIERGQDLRVFCTDVLAYIRDLLVYKMSNDHALLQFTDAGVEELSNLFSETDLVRMFSSLAGTQSKIKDAPTPRYIVEIGLAKVIEMRKLTPLSEILSRLGSLENRLSK